MTDSNSKVIRKQTGFTLVELIVVIVIVGILGVTAVSKFQDLSSDAEIAVLEYVGGTLLAAARLTFAKSAIQGVQDVALTNIDLDGDGTNDIEVAYGFPSGRGNAQAGIANAMGGSFTNDWAYAQIPSTPRVFLATKSSNVGFSGYTNNNIPITTTGCYLLYRSASGPGQAPTISYVTSGC